MSKTVTKKEEETNLFKSTQDAIADVTKVLSKRKRLNNLLEESIKQAKKSASEKLDPELYKVLEELKGWPTTTKEWIDFITKFSRWIPHQSAHDAWTDPESGYAQEVYDRLCHFYFLIDQPVGKSKELVVEDTKYFQKWLRDFANLWGDFLNTTESFNERILKSFMKYSPYYRLEDSMVGGNPNSPSGWLTFNQFFARQLNPGLRPIAGPGDHSVVVSPADCTFKAKYRINQNSEVLENNSKKIKHVVVKKIHKIGNIKELLKGSPHVDKFANGTFVHYFLGPYSYHRFHAPVAGVVDECRSVTGRTYLEVEMKDGQFDAPDSAETKYQFNQARGIITINASAEKYGKKGVVAIIPIGMCQVSGVHMTATEGNPIAKGEEFGYFLFGGSDIIMLFEEGMEPKICESGTYRYYGTDISKEVDSKK